MAFFECALLFNTSVLDVNQRRSSVSEEVITTRCYRDLDVQNSISGLEVEFKDFPYDSDVNCQVDFYIKKSQMVFDINCPESAKKKKIRQHFPWYTSEVRDARKAKRRSERHWRKARSESDREIYLETKKSTGQVIEAAKASYYKTKLKDADSKRVYSTINALLNKSQKILPTGDSNAAPSNKFAMYFVEKIDTLRSALDSHEDSTPEMSDGISLPGGGQSNMKW